MVNAALIDKNKNKNNIKGMKCYSGKRSNEQILNSR